MEKRTRPTMWKVALALAAGAALVALGWRLVAPALLLAAEAAGLAFLLLPLCRAFERLMAPGAAAALSLLSTLLLLAALAWLILPSLFAQLADLMRALPAAMEGARGLLERLNAWTQAVGLGAVALPTLNLENASGGMLAFAAGTVNFAGGVANAVSQITMAAVLAAFFLADRRRLTLRLELLAPLRFRALAVRMGMAAQREVRLYLRAQATVSLAVGALSGLGLWLAGVRSPLALGLLIGVFNLIPYFGPVLGAAPALAAALTSGWQTALFAAVVLIIVQQLDGSVISPRVMGGITGLSPAAVLLGVFAGGCAWGVGGMLLALPCMMVARTCARVLVQHDRRQRRP